MNLDQSERAAMNRLFVLTQPASLNTFVELWETALHGRTRSSLVANNNHTPPTLTTHTTHQTTPNHTKPHHTPHTHTTHATPHATHATHTHHAHHAHHTHHTPHTPLTPRRPTWRGQQLSRKTRSQRTRENRVPDTRKILFQNVTSFGHKARTWLLSDQMDYDIMGVAEHHLDLASAAEEAGRLRVEGYRSIWTPANFTGRGGTSGGTMAMIKPHWKFSRYLEGYGDILRSP